MVSGGECGGDAGKKEGLIMKVAEIEINAGDVDQPYRPVGGISAKVKAATLFSKTPTLEDINLKLQEKGQERTDWVTQFLEYLDSDSRL
jgi:hypothetical protein